MPESSKNHLVVKSNPLIQASYKLTLNEQRLILLAVSGLNSKRLGIRPGSNQVEGIKVTAAEFGEAWNLSAKDAYDALKDATLNLFERAIVEIKGKHTIKTRWVSAVEYHDGQGWAQLSFAFQIIPHLTNLGRNFTEYRLGQVANLRSVYAVRLFEWCIQFAKTGWMEVSVDDLVQRLGVAYTRYADIRRFVIQPAVKELKDKSDMEIDWTPIKDGQKVTAIRFEFREQSQRKLDFDAPPTQATACGGGKRRLRRKP